MDLVIRRKHELWVNQTEALSFLGLNLDIILVAMKVGVPVVPGTPGPVATYSDGDAFIKEHGFPGAFFWTVGYAHRKF